MKEKIESEKSKMKIKYIHRREMRTQSHAEELQCWTPLSGREGSGVSWKSKIENKIHEPQRHKERKVFPNFPVTN
jgi:hypothetical protein